MGSLEKDRSEILRVHHDWWLANRAADIPLMKTCYPTGLNDLMFNFNWHPYFGLDEKVRLWEYYKGAGMTLEDVPDVRIMKFEIIGDLAYIACELELTTVIPELATGLIEETQALPPPGTRLTERARATEVYKRDDGEGGRHWKIWHFHCSPLPPRDALRPAFGDTADSRGSLGWNPWGEPLSVSGPRGGRP